MLEILLLGTIAVCAGIVVDYAQKRDLAARAREVDRLLAEAAEKERALLESVKPKPEPTYEDLLAYEIECVYRQYEEERHAQEEQESVGPLRR